MNAKGWTVAGWAIRSLVALSILIAGLPLSATSVAAQPPVARWSGTVKVMGANVPDGTVITAWVNFVEVGRTTTVLDAGKSLYVISVAGDPATLTGKPVSFLIGDPALGQQAAETAIWAAGVNASLNLSYATLVPAPSPGPPTPTPSPTALPTPATPTLIPAPTHTPVPKPSPTPPTSTTGWADDFNGTTLNPSHWSIVPLRGYNKMLPDVAVANGKLEMAITASEVTNGGVWTLVPAGDFDAQVDYGLNTWRNENVGKFGIRIAPPGSSPGSWGSPFASVERIYDTSFGGNAYVMNLGGSVRAVPTGDMTGSLRIMRTGTNIVGYYLSPRGWVELGSGEFSAGEFELALLVWNDPGKLGTPRVYFDNFRIESPVTPPPTFTPSPTPLSITPTATPTFRPMPTPLPAPTPTRSPTPLPTTPTATPTFRPIPTLMPTPTPMASPGYSRRTPATVGVALFIKFEELLKTYEARVTLMETLRGDAAWQLIRTANIFFNNPPAAGHEYSLARIRFEYLKGPTPDTSLRLSSFDFTAVSSDGRDYERHFVAEPEPRLSGQLYPGATLEGWAAFQVATLDTGPVLVFGRRWDGTGGIWFELSPTPAAATPSPVPAPVPTATPETVPTPTYTPSVAARTTVSVSPESSRPAPGAQFSISISVDPKGRGVSSGEVTVGFDPAALEVRDAVKGTLLGESSLEAKKEVDKTGGRVTLAMARNGATTPPTAPGAFATIEFTVKPDARSGDHKITIQKIGLADEAFRDIPGIDVRHAIVTIGASMPGDIDGNGRVDYIDLGILGAAYGRSKGETGYEARADLNSNGVIDYLDLAILGANYGKGS